MDSVLIRELFARSQHQVYGVMTLQIMTEEK